MMVIEYGGLFCLSLFLCPSARDLSLQRRYDFSTYFRLLCREKSEIEAFVKDAVAAGEHCLGRCLYISGVPGTGKVSNFLLTSSHCD